MKQGRVNVDTNYTEEEIRSNRKFPVGNTILLVLTIAAQIGLIILAICFQPQPQDVIHRYDVTVQPLADGSLDIEYHLVWEALDTSEPLTWVEIGMANRNFTVYQHSVSSNIQTYSKQADGDYVALRLDFRRAYRGGEVIEFSFKINQRDMLCVNDSGYFYEFVPSWFNAIEVQHYTFTWRMADGRDLVQTGSLDCGEYRKMTAQYGPEDFAGCQTIGYTPFNDHGTNNDLQEDKIGVIILCCMGILLLLFAQLYIVDSYVSYDRGRGFLSDHGYYMHTYGRPNPHYIRARNAYNATHRSRGGGSGGCACACACACAGGGRAGCSQKDTYRCSHWRQGK